MFAKGQTAYVVVIRSLGLLTPSTLQSDGTYRTRLYVMPVTVMGCGPDRILVEGKRSVIRPDSDRIQPTAAAAAGVAAKIVAEKIAGGCRDEIVIEEIPHDQRLLRSMA